MIDISLKKTAKITKIITVKSEGCLKELLSLKIYVIIAKHSVRITLAEFLT